MLAKAVLGAISLAGCVASASAIEVILLPVADTTIYRGAGFSESASNALGENLSVGQSADGVTRRALLRFDLSSIAPGAVVESARLTLFESRSRGDYDVTLHRLSASWGEGASNGGSAGQSGTATAGDATWMRSRHPDVLWASPGGDFVSNASASTFVGTQGASYAWFSPTMAADAQSWIDQPGTNFGWILIGEESTDQNAKLFGSRQSGAVPTLVLEISPVPEPDVYVTMAVGAGLIGWRLRQRQRRADGGRLSMPAA